MPAEVLELPQKGDRIIHFAWEPHVRVLNPPAACAAAAFVQWTHASALLLQPGCASARQCRQIASVQSPESPPYRQV